MGFFKQAELQEIGFKHLGSNVKISDRCSLYNPSNITVCDNVRVDDFCILSAGAGGIELGDYVHVGCYTSIIGQARVVLKAFSGVSGRVSIYSSNDDYSGFFMAHPTIPEELRDVATAEVVLEKHVLVGASAVILPGVHIGEGAAIGALSLVKDDCEPFMIYGGVPAKRLKERNRRILQLEQQFVRDLTQE